MTPESEIAAAILRLTEARGADKSICPSEVARALDPAWQSLMAPVRKAAIALAAAGRIDILRKGKPVGPDGVPAGSSACAYAPRWHDKLGDARLKSRRC